MQILAGRGKRLGCGILKVPELVLHATIEFVGIPFTFQMELHTNGRVHTDRKIIVDDVVRHLKQAKSMESN